MQPLVLKDKNNIKSLKRTRERVVIHEKFYGLSSEYRAAYAPAVDGQARESYKTIMKAE